MHVIDGRLVVDRARDTVCDLGLECVRRLLATTAVAFAGRMLMAAASEQMKTRRRRMRTAAGAGISQYLPRHCKALPRENF